MKKEDNIITIKDMYKGNAEHDFDNGYERCKQDFKKAMITNVKRLREDYYAFHSAVHGLLSRVNQVEGSEYWHPQNVKDVVELANKKAQIEILMEISGLTEKDLK